MTITRRDALLGLAASVGFIAPISGLSLPPSAPTGPIELGQYFILYRRNPIWLDHFAWPALSPFLSTHRWQFDDRTYDTPLIRCVDNGRVFMVISFGEPVQEERVGVFEIWAPCELLNLRDPDIFSDEFTGAARHAAARAAAIVGGRRTIHRGAVYIDFPADDLASPIITDAPPIIIHTWLSPSRWPVDEDEESEEAGSFEKNERA